MNAELVKRQDRWDLYGEDGSKIASSAPNPFNKLSIKNCEAIANGYDLNELSHEEYLLHENNQELYGHSIELKLAYKAGVYDGLKRMLTVLGDKKFSESDMINAYIEGTNDGAQFESMMDYDHSDNSEAQNFSEQAEQDFRKLLQQTEFDVEIVMECGEVKQCECGSNKNCLNQQPKLDADGCLILRRL